MANSKINNYVARRYNQWLDYARYHCRKAGRSDEAEDVLNEVLLSVLCKEESKLSGMIDRKSGEYTEFDWFVLRSLRTNICCPTSPYRQKADRISIDRSVLVERLEIADVSSEEEDQPGEILEQMNQVRSALNTLQLDQRVKQIFHFRFFAGESFKNWTGKENLKKLYGTYNEVLEMVRQRVNGRLLL